MTISGARKLPPELENARKILEAERKEGCRDRVVTTGLASFLAQWERRVAATGQPELRTVARAVTTELDGYASLAPPARAERIETALGLKKKKKKKNKK